MSRVLTLARPRLVPTALSARTLMTSLDSWARGVFAAAVDAVQPDVAVRRSVERRGDALAIAGRVYALRRNLYVAGFGKAVLGMAAEAERLAGEHLVGGVVSVPHGIRRTLRQQGKEHLLLKEESRIVVMEGAEHNLPDADAQRAAEEIRRLASGLTEDDLLLVLISGGGSALLPAPVPPITLQEKLDVTRRLAGAGAAIQELNTVRRALSLLKGGGLARCAHPAQVVALILSDVIGDPLDLIASGPTAPGLARPGGSEEEALSVLERHGLLDSVPASVRRVLAGGAASPSPPPGTPGRVLNVIIGSNALALEGAALQARELGLHPLVLAPGVLGDVRPVSRLYGLLARYACGQGGPEVGAELLRLGPGVGVAGGDLRRVMQALEERSPEGCTICLLAGGEPTVELTGKGCGGRNQELALRVGLELQGLPGPVFLSGGTDGQDGPTAAAGAVADSGLEAEARAQGLDTASSLARNDSHTFFTQLSAGRRLLVPGLTGTNVMDVHMLLLPPVPGSASV